MKTLEELEMLTVDQLKGIATGLGVEPNAKIKKAELVQLVYDVQQPAPDEAQDAEAAADTPAKPIDTDERIAKMRAEVEAYFNGEMIDTAEEDENGLIIHEVINEDADVIAKGNLMELHSKAIEAPEDADVVTDIPLSPEDDEVEDVATPPLADDADVTDIEKALNALRPFGLQYKIDGSSVLLRCGSKAQTTTLNQPAHRVVRTAETICNFQR